MLLQLNNLVLKTDSVENLFIDNFESLFPQILNERMGKRKNEEAKRQSVAAYILLNEILIGEYGVSFQDIRFTENGKPYFENGPFVSVAHSGEKVCAAVSDFPIGVDIEQIRNCDLKIADRFFSNKEKRYILKKDSITRFLTLWTLKEAIIKKEGKTLSEMGNIKLKILFGKIFYKNYRLITKIHENCVISVCFSKKTGI